MSVAVAEQLQKWTTAVADTASVPLQPGGCRQTGGPAGSPSCSSAGHQREALGPCHGNNTALLGTPYALGGFYSRQWGGADAAVGAPRI
jgi:hypothetical protein